MLHRRPKFPPALLLAALALTLAGCAANPVTGKRELSLISTGQEIAMGEQHYLSSQQAAGGLYTADAALTEYVAAVGRRLAAVSDRELPYEFVVLNDGTPNAWALPGGKIAINRGLLLQLDNEAELAAVLAHEIVHAAARHGARAVQRSVFTGLLGAALPGDVSNTVVGAAGKAVQLINRNYSRKAESAADYHGMKYMRAAGYDTSAAVTLQEKFVALSESESAGQDNWLSGLFASHPPSAERVKANRAALAEFPPGGELGRGRYQGKLAYLRARRGAYANAERARQLIETDAQSALRAINAAIKQEPREALFRGIKGHALTQQERLREAAREYDAAIQMGPDFYQWYLVRGIIHFNFNERRQARAALERSNELLSTALGAYSLGGILLDDGERERAKQLFRDASGAGGELGKSARLAFVKLDIADEPGRYVGAAVSFAGGEVMVTVKNLTPYQITGIVIQVDATINGQPASARPSLARLAPGDSVSLPGGIRYWEEDEVEAAAKAVRARLAGSE